jgi:dihydropteroate synthase
MGILNVTPDSFSDGGQFNSPVRAIDHFESLLGDGAAIIDIGAESTRPGAADVNDEEEWGRLEAILKYAAKTHKIARVSVDTRKFSVMERAVKLGATMLNVVGPLPEEGLLSKLFSYNPDLSFVACHMHGTPQTMQLNPLGPASAIKRVLAYFDSSSDELIEAGCKRENIFLDPGIGFGKTDSANIQLLKASATFAKDYRLALGISRKGFISRLIGSDSIEARDGASKAIEAGALLSGIRLIRTHNVRQLRTILNLLGDIPAGVPA